MNFQVVSVGQKLKGNGYLDGLGTPSPGLAGALQHVDQSLGAMVAALRQHDLLDSTTIIITAKHGQSPIEITKRQTIGHGITAAPSDLLSGVGNAAQDDISLIWLTDPSQTANDFSILSVNQTAIGAQQIFTGNSLELVFNPPATDPRVPNLIVQVNRGVIYTHGSKIAEHGGFAEDDVHVALLISNAELRPQLVRSAVNTTLLAPTILSILGIPAKELQAVQKEHTNVLPAVQLGGR